MWSNLAHPNIAPFLGISYDLGRPGMPSIVYPYYPNGNIMDFLKNRSHVNKIDLVNFIDPAETLLIVL